MKQQEIARVFFRMKVKYWDDGVIVEQKQSNDNRTIVGIVINSTKVT